MKRRNFVLGVGATATGGSALLGTGAFTSVEAERDVAVDVAGDDEAFLRLGPCTDADDDPRPNGDYVVQENGLFGISLSDDNSDVSGDGVNSEALSRFHNVFEVCNQGTQSVCVDFAVDVPVIPNGADVPDRYDFEDGDLAVIFYRGDDPSDPINVDDLDPDRSGGFPLEVGECQCVGLEVRAFGFDTGEDLFEGAQLEIFADADADCSGSPPADPPERDLELTYADNVVKSESDQGETRGGSTIDQGRSEFSHATGDTEDFFSLGFKPDGNGGFEEDGGQLTVEFEEKNELVKRGFDTDVVGIETTNNRPEYPEEKALVEVAGPETNGFVEVGTATSKASNGESTFELPGEPIRKVRLTDRTDPSKFDEYPNADGFDVKAIKGYTESS
jgi:hypothetical protein